MFVIFLNNKGPIVSMVKHRSPKPRFQVRVLVGPQERSDEETTASKLLCLRQDEKDFSLSSRRDGKVPATVVESPGGPAFARVNGLRRGQCPPSLKLRRGNGRERLFLYNKNKKTRASAGQRGLSTFCFQQSGNGLYAGLCLRWIHSVGDVKNHFQITDSGRQRNRFF